MATTKNTKNTNPAAKAFGEIVDSVVGTTKRETVELPDLKVSESTADLSIKATRTRTNPLAGAAALANTNRDKVYQVAGIETQKQADKVLRLLVDAGRNLTDADGNDTPCSFRTKVDLPNKVVHFRAVDLVTRKRKDK